MSVRSRLRAFLGDAEPLLDELPREAAARAKIEPGGRSRRRPVPAAAFALIALVVTAVPAFAVGVGDMTFSAPKLISQGPPYTNPFRISSLSCASATSCVATTEAGGRIISSATPTGTSDSTWSVLSSALISQGATGYELADSSCVTTGTGPFCALAGVDFSGSSGVNPGVILTSTNPTGDEHAWQRTALPRRVNEVSCSQGGSTTLCAAADAGGSIRVSTDPAGGAGTWANISPTLPPDASPIGHVSCGATTLCAGLTYGGLFLSAASPATAASWSATSATGLASGRALSCPTSTFCLATGSDVASNLQIAVTTNPASGASATWSLKTPAHVTGAVSCWPDPALASPSVLCMGLSDAAGKIEVSTDGGTNWATETAGIGTAFAYYSGFACVGDTLCLAGDGRISHSASASSGGGATWSAPVEAAGGTNSLRIPEASCNSAALCVGIDAAGRIFTSSDPASASWTSGVVDSGRVIMLSACPSESLCVALDDVGNVITSTNPSSGAGSWSAPENIDPTAGGFAALECPSTSLCVATDWVGNVYTTTNPAGGGPSWSMTPDVDPKGLSLLSCPTASLCVGSDYSGQVVTSTNPAGGVGAWSTGTPGDPNFSIDQLDCPSASLCVAVNYANYVMTSTNPAGGAATWTTVASGATDGLTTLDCPSATFCAAGSLGAVISSTNPSGGGSTWSSPQATGLAFISRLSCPVSDACVAAADFTGQVARSVRVSGGAATWSGAVTITDHGSASLACPTLTLCVVPDSAGSVVTGTAPSPPSGPSNGDPPPSGGSPPLGSDPAPTPADVGNSAATPQPVAGRSANVAHVSGTIRIRRPGAAQFVLLTQDATLPSGTLIDARRGVVTITLAPDSSGRVFSARAKLGEFVLRLAKKGPTTFELAEPLTGCARAKRTGTSAKKRKKGAKKRQLWVQDDGGSWRTRGQYAAATTLGTTWITRDTCTSTVIEVRSGAVLVRRNTGGKAVRVNAGKRNVTKRR